MAGARRGGESDVSAGERGGAARALAADVVAIRRSALPDAVLARARDLLLDYLGVTLAGAVEESTVVLRRGLAALGTSGDATVIGTPLRMAPPHAALANGAAAHAIEMDDTHLGGSIHLGASVLSATLAAAELVPASGATCLRAAVAGYEVAARLAMALGPAQHYRRGFHPTGTCGAFGAAAAAGVVLGLDVDGITTALGIAGSQAAGSMEFLEDGAWTKRFHPGWAASAGLHAAALAGAGFRAPASILDGRFGFLGAYSDAPDLGALGPGGTYALMETGIKPHACCRYSQGPIDAALALRRAHAIDPARIARIDVGIVAAGFPIVCEPLDAKRRPRSVVDAQFSLPFSIATALVRGAAWPDDFTPACCEDPAIRRLMAAVHPARDAALDAHYPRTWPCWLRITLDDGTRHETRVDHPLGDPENFPDATTLAAKFARLATRALEPERARAVHDAVTAIVDNPDVRDLLALVRTDK
jgi:2-methylcitrate dehydratase PrpD